MPDLEDIFVAVRKACKPAQWSGGVELQRAGAISIKAQDDEEWTFGIAVPGSLVQRQVYLFLDDTEWDCDCGTRFEACEHVAAAVLFAKHTNLEEAEATPPALHGTLLIYKLSKTSAGLEIERVIRESDGKEIRLDATLNNVARGRVPGVRLQPTQADLAVELALGRQNPQTLGTYAMQKLCRRLAHVEHIEFEGTPVSFSTEALGPAVEVVDQGDSFFLKATVGDAFDEKFANGVVRKGDRFHPYREPAWSARDRERFQRGESVAYKDVGELVDTRLPELKKQGNVIIRTDRLPSSVRIKPRIDWEIAKEADTLEVLPTLVYGDPILAKVEGDRWVYLQGEVPRRDRDEERRLADRLLQHFDLKPGARIWLRGAEAVQFHEQYKSFSLATAKDVPKSLQSFTRAAPLTVKPGKDGLPAFVLAGSNPDADPSKEGLKPAVSPRAVIEAWLAGDSMVSLGEHGFSELPTHWLAEHGEALREFLMAQDVGASAERALAQEQMALIESVGGIPPATLVSQVEGWLQGPPPVEVDGKGRFTLREYQKEGVAWLKARRDEGFGSLLADDMGLGKTLQAIALAPHGTLVVAPTSVLPNWQSEIEKFRPELNVNVYHGPNRTLEKQADLTLTTYAILRLDQDTLSAEEWEWIVLDEAQAIKNPDSKVARAAFKLRSKANTALTGTPVENRLQDLWSIFHFLIPGLLGSREAFEQTFAKPIAAGDMQKAERLRSRVRPFILRRLKEQVAPELPPRTEVVQRFDLNKYEREQYNVIRAATQNEIISQMEQGGNVMQALEALLRLRQMACHASLVPGCEIDQSTKTKLLLSMLETTREAGSKALVFSQWTSLLDLVEESLKEDGHPFTRLDGTTRDRKAVVDEFQNPNGPPILLISLKAGGTGLNLTAADHVFILDPWWNPAAERQAADRAHRIGQDKPVMIYRLVARDTVEEKVLELQERKQALMGAAIGEGVIDAMPTREELIDLLR